MGTPLFKAKTSYAFGNSTSAQALTMNAIGSSGNPSSGYRLAGVGQFHSVYIETDAACTCSYQIRTGRTDTGPWVVLSSATLSTGAVDLVQIQGPLSFISPRIKTIGTGGSASTAINAFVEILVN